MDEDIRQEKKGYKPYFKGAFVDPEFWKYRLNVELRMLLFTVKTIRDGRPKLAMWVFKN